MNSARALGFASVSSEADAPTDSSTRTEPVVIAIDGTSGSGKSTTAKAVAQALAGDYVDTGAMYRAVAWWMLRNDIDVTQTEQVAAAVAGVTIAVSAKPGAFRVTCNGHDVTSAVRDVLVTDAVSTVAAVPAVRAALCSYQRDLAANASVHGRPMVMEGRDIGTVVLPAADVKVWLTADVAARAARRAGDGEGPVAETSARLITRDEMDSSRPVSPAQMAADAVQIDTTHTDVEDVVIQVLQLVQRASNGRR